MFTPFHSKTNINHFHGTASQTERLREHRTSTAVSNDFVHGGNGCFDRVIQFLSLAHRNLVWMSEIVRHLLGSGIGRVPHT